MQYIVLLGIPYMKFTGCFECHICGKSRASCGYSKCPGMFGCRREPPVAISGITWYGVQYNTRWINIMLLLLSNQNTQNSYLYLYMYIIMNWISKNRSNFALLLMMAWLLVTFSSFMVWIFMDNIPRICIPQLDFHWPFKDIQAYVSGIVGLWFLSGIICLVTGHEYMMWLLPFISLLRKRDRKTKWANDSFFIFKYPLVYLWFISV